MDCHGLRPRNDNTSLRAQRSNPHKTMHSPTWNATASGLAMTTRHCERSEAIHNIKFRYFKKISLKFCKKSHFLGILYIEKWIVIHKRYCNNWIASPLRGSQWRNSLMSVMKKFVNFRNNDRSIQVIASCIKLFVITNKSFSSLRTKAFRHCEQKLFVIASEARQSTYQEA